MTDLPVSSINPNTDATTASANPQDDTVASLNAILNQPSPLSTPTQNTDSSDMPAIEIDLKKNYVKKQPQEVQPASSFSYGGSPFGAPRPAEIYTDNENITRPEHIENIVNPEVEKSAEILKPEQASQQDSSKQVTEIVQDVVPGKVVDLRKVAEKPKVAKKDIAPTASKLTMKANDTENEFIESILGAHGD